MIKISIIVPVYNVEKVLSRCMESLINQTFKEIEIILVDDGSSDSSSYICDDFAARDSRVKVIHKVNGGVSKARNTGLSIAKGVYIQFVDSDDYLEINACELLYENAILYNSELVVCGYNKHTNESITKITYREKMYHDLISVNTDFKHLFDKMFFNYIWNKLYLKSKIYTGFNEELNYGEDLLFNIDYIRNIKTISIINECLYNYFFLNDTLSTKYSKNKIKDSEYIYLESISFVADLFNNKENQSIVRQKHFARALILFKQISKSDTLTYTEKVVEMEKIVNNTSFRDSVRIKKRNLKEVLVSLFVSIKAPKFILFMFNISKYNKRGRYNWDI